MMMVRVLKLHGMSNQRIREIVAMIYAISITESAINRTILRKARELRPLYEQIRKEVRQSPMYSEEEKFIGQINQIVVLYFKNYF